MLIWKRFNILIRKTFNIKNDFTPDEEEEEEEEVRRRMRGLLVQIQFNLSQNSNLWDENEWHILQMIIYPMIPHAFA